MKFLPILLLSAALACAEDAPSAVSFRNHIQPILAKTGCSLGACHGAAAGQGGFKLSLRGYDDEGDYLTLTRGAFGRRITPADPARSLLLLKPTNAVPHKGGEKFKVGSPEWTTIVNWIAQGAPGPQPDDARIQRLEIEPALVQLQPGAEQQFTVRAHFSDGHTEDVTRHVKYTATNQAVINVDEVGKVNVLGNGESAVTAWYLSQIAVGTVSSPFPHQLAPVVFEKAERRNWIDDLVLAKLRALNLAPSPRCTDGEFIRRAFLDTCGILPTPDETRAFLADTAPDKRDHVIEALLARPEFTDYWSYKWSDLLLVTKRKLKPAAMWAYSKWIRDQVASDTPWDEFARRLLTAQGSTLENGAANYFVIHPDPREVAETTSMTFLGFSMNCAKCHNHPMEKWTNNDYYGFANLFSRVRLKNGAQDGENTVFSTDDGELVQPLTGKPQHPRPLDGKAARFRRRRRSPGRARGCVNLAREPLFQALDHEPGLGEFLRRRAGGSRGRHPRQQPCEQRAAAHRRREFPRRKEVRPARADARHFAERNLSALQRGPAGKPGGHALLRPLLSAPTDGRSRARRRRASHQSAHRFQNERSHRGGRQGAAFPVGWRAVQLPDAGTDSYFTRTFGRAARENTCECERTSEPSVTQALHLSNGDTINQKLSAKDGVISTALASEKPPAQWIEDAYLAALSRLPTTAEQTHFAALFADEKTDRRPLLEDVYWALLTSREFLFNH